MNESQQSSGDLLIVTMEKPLSAEAAQRMAPLLENMEKRLGVRIVVLEDGMKATVDRDMSGLIKTIESQTKAISELAAVNQRILQAMLEEPEDGDQAQSGGYLNG
jgi:chaperone required for assembly of F1-ATPase